MDIHTLSQTSTHLLTHHFLFQGMTTQGLHRGLSDVRCTCTQAIKGEVIYAPHQFSRCLGLILSGRVQVNKEDLIVSVLKDGDLFGAAALFNQNPDYVTTLTAQCPCQVLLFPQDFMEEWMASCPTLSLNYITYLSGRIRFLSDKIEGLIVGSVEEKLAQHLLRWGDGAPLVLDCSITGLAQRLNVSRASLYRAFDALEDAKAIRRRGKVVEILDLSYLSHEKGSP